MAGKQHELMRQSHFHIGSFNNKYSTIYSDSFIGSPTSHAKVGRKADIEKTQIVLGSDQASKSSETESRKQYIQFSKGPDHDALSLSIKKDLASHHFRFGNNNPIYSTTSKDSYTAHNAKSQSLNDELNKLMKTSSVPFNYSPKSIESTNRAEFYAKKDEHAKNFQVSRNLVSDFKRAHFDLGFSGKTRASTMRDSYSPNFNFVPEGLKEVPKYHSVVLGYEKPNIRPWDDREKKYQITRKSLR